jgi:rubrerythrin
VYSSQVTSLLQTQSSKRRVAVKQRVTTLLERRAELLSSSTLKLFANEVASSPFAKVTGLIKALVAKLKEEAAAEAEHKQWCDDQLKANKLARNKQGTQSEKLSASIEKLSGEIDTMGKEIATLLSEQSALSKAQSKATDIRNEEKSRNADTVRDATAGAEATKQAYGVLKKFYSSQAFVQAAQAPDMESFKGSTGASKL